MQGLPENAWDHILREKHSTQKKSGVFSKIWNDTAIDLSHLKFNHNSSGLLGQEIERHQIMNSIKKNKKFSLHTIKMIEIISDHVGYVFWSVWF